MVPAGEMGYQGALHLQLSSLRKTGRRVWVLETPDAIAQMVDMRSLNMRIVLGVWERVKTLSQ